MDLDGIPSIDNSYEKFVDLLIHVFLDFFEDNFKYETEIKYYNSLHISFHIIMRIFLESEELMFQNSLLIKYVMEKFLREVENHLYNFHTKKYLEKYKIHEL